MVSNSHILKEMQAGANNSLTLPITAKILSGSTPKVSPSVITILATTSNCLFKQGKDFF